MALLDEIQGSEGSDEEQQLQGAPLLKGIQRPAGTMTRPGVMSEAGVGAAPRAGQDVPTSPQQAQQWSQNIDLQRIGQIARSLQGVPEEARTQILARILGIPIKSKQQQAMEMMQQRLVQQLQAQQGIQQRHNERMRLDTGYRAEQMKQHRTQAKVNLANAIERLTKRVTDPQANIMNPDALVEANKTLISLQKQFEQLEKMDAPKEQPGGGAGAGGGSAETSLNKVSEGEY